MAKMVPNFSHFVHFFTAETEITASAKYHQREQRIIPSYPEAPVRWVERFLCHKTFL